MPSSDPDRARSRFIRAVKRSIEGARLERTRIQHACDSAPRLLEGTEHEVVNLTGLPDNDLDYYVYELGRLQDAAREAIRVFDSPLELVRALAEFDLAVPNLRSARNPLTHPSDDARLDDVGWFSAFVRLGYLGSVEYLVDPRYEHHEAAERLTEVMLSYFRGGLRAT
jgi:hypothetical protein